MSTANPSPTTREEALHRLIDGQLDAAEEAALRAEVARDPALAVQVEGMAADRAALRAALAGKVSEPVPVQLRLDRLATQRRGFGAAQMAAAAALFALGMGLGWGLGRGAPPALVAEHKATLVDEAQVAYAVYSVEVRHPVEVGAGEREHLMAWLSKRLGRPLTAPDLSAQGYELVGGRLLPASAGPAAQLMYEDASGLRLTLYITAMPGSESAFRYVRNEAGLSSLIWLEDGYGCAISAPIARAELWTIAQSAYEALAL